MRKASQKGFTLIELLIVIGLLGALTAIVLPSLSADREDALGSVCDYNQAGTVRTLKEYANVIGNYPNQFHTGMTVATGGIGNGASNTIMGGIPEAQSVNIGATASDNFATTLSAVEVQSLANAGITKIAYDEGYHVADIAATTTSFLSPWDGTNSWQDDGGNDYSFDGHSIHAWESANNATDPDSNGWFDKDGTGDVVVLWITPTIDWTNDSANANKDWTKGAVKMEIALEGQCPIPGEDINGNDPDFAYYMAYFKVYSSDSGGTAYTTDDVPAAVLIGTTCPECGIMNP